MSITISDPVEFLLAALKDGYIPHKDDLFLIHGPGGVGKSSLIAMFLGQQRDFNRASTAVAEESLHLSPVRDVSTSMFTDKWELVDINRQARMVAHTSHHLLSSKRIEVDENAAKVGSEEVTESKPFLAKYSISPAAPSSEEPPPAVKQPKVSKKHMLSKFTSSLRRKKKEQTSTNAQYTPAPSAPVKKVAKDIKENVQEIDEKFMELVDHVEKSFKSL